MRSRISATDRAARCAAAAVALTALIGGCGTSTPSPSASSPSSSSTGTTSAQTTTSSVATSGTTSAATTAPTIAATTKPVDLAEGDLLTAADYSAAGWKTSRVTTEFGVGRYALGYCQNNNPPESSGRVAAYLGSMESNADSRYGKQVVVSFSTPAQAAAAFALVDNWNRGCKPESKVNAVDVPGGKATFWVGHPKAPGGPVISEFITAALIGDRVSIVVLQTGTFPRSFKPEALILQAAKRLA